MPRYAPVLLLRSALRHCAPTAASFDVGAHRRIGSQRMHIVNMSASIVNQPYLSPSCISAITLTSSLENRISLMQAMKPDRGSHVTMTFSKATRLFSRWSNSGKSSSSSCDSRAVSCAEEPGLRGYSSCILSALEKDQDSR